MTFKVTYQTGVSQTIELNPVQTHVLTEKLWSEYCKAEGKPTAEAYGEGHKLLCALFYGSVERVDVAPSQPKTK